MWMMLMMLMVMLLLLLLHVDRRQLALCVIVAHVVIRHHWGHLLHRCVVTIVHEHLVLVALVSRRVGAIDGRTEVLRHEELAARDEVPEVRMLRRTGEAA